MVVSEVESKRSKSQLKRDQIIESASKLFIEHGYPNTSMDKVAKEAGVSKQTVYSHFKDKETLFVETVGARCAASEFTSPYAKKRSGASSLSRSSYTPVKTRSSYSKSSYSKSSGSVRNSSSRTSRGVSRGK